jgi:hypothetical protein
MGTQKCQILYQCHMGHVLVRVLVSGMGAGVQFDKKNGGGGGGGTTGKPTRFLAPQKKGNADVWVTLVSQLRKDICVRCKRLG